MDGANRDSGLVNNWASVLARPSHTQNRHGARSRIRWLLQQSRQAKKCTEMISILWPVACAVFLDRMYRGLVSTAHPQYLIRAEFNVYDA